MSKRLFQILDEMNMSDIENKTQMVSISNHLVEAKSCKAGGLITMGADHLRMQQLALGQNHIALLVIVDKKEYEKFKNTQ